MKDEIKQIIEECYVLALREKITSDEFTNRIVSVVKERDDKVIKSLEEAKASNDYFLKIKEITLSVHDGYNDGIDFALGLLKSLGDGDGGD